MADRIHVIIADPQYLTRIGLGNLFASSDGISVAGEATDADQLLKMVEKGRVDVVVLDYHRSEAFPLEEIGRIKKTSPSTQFLVVTDDSYKANIFRALELGVNGILTKNCSKDEILSAVQATAKGEKFFCNKVLDILLEKHIGGAGAEEEEEDCSSASLSLREVEIVEMIASGIATKEIAGKLCLSPHTVYTHRKNIMKKLGVNSAAELVMHAVKAGIVKTGQRVD